VMRRIAEGKRNSSYSKLCKQSFVAAILPSPSPSPFIFKPVFLLFLASQNPTSQYFVNMFQFTLARGNIQ